jgi:hypothetical protein
MVLVKGLAEEQEATHALPQDGEAAITLLGSFGTKVSVHLVECANYK